MTEEVRHSRIDGVVFWCRECDTKKSIKEGTIFENYDKTPLIILTRIIIDYYVN